MLIVVSFTAMLGALLALAVGIEADLPTTVLVVGVPLIGSFFAGVVALAYAQKTPCAPMPDLDHAGSLSDAA